mgnify:CR=1 FL=1
MEQRIDGADLVDRDPELATTLLAMPAMLLVVALLPGCSSPSKYQDVGGPESTFPIGAHRSEATKLFNQAIAYGPLVMDITRHMLRGRPAPCRELCAAARGRLERWLQGLRGLIYSGAKGFKHEVLKRAVPAGR